MSAAAAGKALQPLGAALADPLLFAQLMGRLGYPSPVPARRWTGSASCCPWSTPSRSWPASSRTSPAAPSTRWRSSAPPGSSPTSQGPSRRWPPSRRTRCVACPARSAPWRAGRIWPRPCRGSCWPTGWPPRHRRYSRCSAPPGSACPRYRGPASFERFRWDQLAALLGDPLGSAAATYRWGGDFAAWPLQRRLGDALSGRPAGRDPGHARPRWPRPSPARPSRGGAAPSPTWFSCAAPRPRAPWSRSACCSPPRPTAAARSTSATSWPAISPPRSRWAATGR